MRYDDERRPRSVSADSAALQVNGSPLPVITLIRPMESEKCVGYRCGGGESCKFRELPEEDRLYKVGQMFNSTSACNDCEQILEPVWGWLASIHGHTEGSRFSYYTTWIANVQEFSEAFLEDPEAALARWFKYNGPEEKKSVPKVSVPSLWEE